MTKEGFKELVKIAFDGAAYRLKAAGLDDDEITERLGDLSTETVQGIINKAAVDAGPGQGKPPKELAIAFVELAMDALVGEVAA